jgi:hypothetical protein
MGARSGAYRVLVEKPEGKKPFGRPRRGWEENIGMGLQKVGCGGMGWIDLARDIFFISLPPLKCFPTADVFK